MLAALLICAFQATVAVPDIDRSQAFTSVDDALSGLSSARSEVRIRAERFLIGRLSPADLPRIVNFVAQLGASGEASMDALWRVGHAIGSGGSNLPMALELFRGGAGRGPSPGLDLEPLETGVPSGTDSLDKALVTIGDHAIDELISGWRTGLDRLPVSGAALQLLLREERERESWTPLEFSDGAVADVIGRLSRLGELPAPLVIAPHLAELLAQERFVQAEDTRDELFQGPWDLVLLDFAQSHSLTWEAVLSDGEFGDEIAWLRLVKGGSQGIETGLEQVRRALEDYGRNRLGNTGPNGISGKPQEAAPGRASELQLTARFLSGIEWPASRSWLGDLWFNNSIKDGLAFAALLESAGRGQFDPRFLTPQGLTRLLRYGDRIGNGESSKGAHRERLRHAFAKLPRFGTSGALDGVVLEGWESKEEMERMTSDAMILRLAALEATGGGGSEGARRAKNLLQTEGKHAIDSEVQIAALRVLAAAVSETSSERVVAANPAALTALAGVRIAPDELGRLLSFARVRVPLAALQSTVPRLRPATLRAVFAAALLEGNFGVTSAILVDVVGADKQGSWARVLEGQSATRSFDQLHACLESAVRRGDLLVVRNVIESARALSNEQLLEESMGETLFDEPAALDRLELLAGAMPLAKQALLLEHIVEKGGASPMFSDSLSLAQLAASPGGSVGRSLLIGRLDQALQSPKMGEASPALRAIEHTLALLWARNADDEARILVMETAGVAAGNAAHPLSKRILYSSWPPSIARISRNLDLLDR
ncbi:MAG: hypothetical protein OSB10_00615 [Planctomycetota bacterium]|nr:hypothetical protein [Planctomycetota bacterium]